jgi:hypothetical protein
VKQSLVAAGQLERSGAATVEFPRSGGRFVVGAVLLAALTAPWTGVKLATGGAPADVLIVLAVGVAGLMVVFGGLRFSVPTWPLLPCLAILVCVLVRQIDPPPAYIRVLRMQLYGYYPDDIKKGLFWLFALLLVPIAIVACTAIERRAAVWTMGAFVTGTTVSCAIALTDLVGLTPNIGRAVGESTQICTYTCFNAGIGTRMNGLTDHPNTLGITAALSIPVAVYFASTMKRNWIGVLALVVLFGGILASGSRGAQAVAPFAALAALLWTPTSRTMPHFRSIVVFGSALVGLVTVVLLPDHIRQGLLRIFDTSQDAEGSNSERLGLFRTAVEDWHAHPVFGSGIRHLVEAHNIFLQFLASGGVVLALAMIVYFFLVLHACWRLAGQGILYARYLMITIGTWLLLGMVTNAVADRYLYYAVGCITALASVYLRPSGSTEREPLQADSTPA